MQKGCVWGSVADAGGRSHQVALRKVSERRKGYLILCTLGGWGGRVVAKQQKGIRKDIEDGETHTISVYGSGGATGVAEGAGAPGPGSL